LENERLGGMSDGCAAPAPRSLARQETILLNICYAMYLDFKQVSPSASFFDATHTARVAQKIQIDQRGL
jgi:hypothetical protein